MGKYYRNPWSNRWVNRYGRYNEPNQFEREAIEREAIQAESMGTRPCMFKECKGIAYYRPGVGGWWCDTCKELQRERIRK